MSALGMIQSALVQVPGVPAVVPLTNSTGGTSVGNVAAGAAGMVASAQGMMGTVTPATMGDKVGAGFLTFAVLTGVIGGSTFMVMGS